HAAMVTRSLWAVKDARRFFAAIGSHFQKRRRRVVCQVSEQSVGSGLVGLAIDQTRCSLERERGAGDQRETASPGMPVGREKTHARSIAAQEALRRYCPEVPADQGMIACAVLFEKEPTPRCRILLATKEVIRRHSKDTTLKIIEANTANCFRLVEQEAAK